MKISPLYWLLLVLVAVESVFVFPGRSYLQSDTQIYIPLFEHLRDNTLLQRDLLLEGAHLRYTIYDEVTLGLNWLSGVDFEFVLVGQQLLFRFLGVVGAFLLARACGLGGVASTVVSGVLWMGAFVYGPAIITTEYEPVPRSFAVPLTVLALGLRATGASSWLAGAALGLAFLYHAPAIWPVLLIALWKKDWKMLAPVALAGGVLALLGARQAGVVEAQPFFSFLSETHKKIQQTRAPYNWLFLWLPRYFWTFALTGVLAIFGFRRLEGILSPAVRPYFLYLPWIGAATIPLSYVLLEQWGWALFPQVQPMRALLYCHLFCQWLGAIVACQEIADKKWLRAATWLLLPLSLSIRGDLLLLTPTKWVIQGALVLGIVAVCWVATRRQGRWLAPALLAVPFLFAWKGDGAPVRLDTPDLRATAEWARQNTPKEAMFLFPDLGRKLEPGIFRARAARAVYVCWKQGGQVNYFASYAEKWWERWSELQRKGHGAMSYADLRARGVEYLVLSKEEPQEQLPLLYESPAKGYRVYRLQ